MPSIQAQCDALIQKWQPKFSEAHFDAVVSSPFVIAGDGGTENLKHYRDGTIVPAERALHHQFFDKSPDEPILILLFESDQSYRRYSKEWFDETDVPYFGYFRRDRVMLMNVSTGTGTLVHELTHALLAPDLPNVPDWFNEGLASLYEQSQFTGDGIKGLKNWRLPALQLAIKENKLRPLFELMRDKDFYGQDLVGLNYAQARYLLMYLQEKDQLQTFYRQLRAHITDDPTGEQTFKKLIAPASVEEFESKWRDWVVHL
jgi:hypothetical protein